MVARLRSKLANVPHMLFVAGVDELGQLEEEKLHREGGVFQRAQGAPFLNDDQSGWYSLRVFVSNSIALSPLKLKHPEQLSLSWWGRF